MHNKIDDNIIKQKANMKYLIERFNTDKALYWEN